MKYIALLRGINVGGNNKVPISELKVCFENLGHTEVKTYINSGNVVFTSAETDEAILREKIEKSIKAKFGFSVQVLVISSNSFSAVVKNKPKGFGENPQMYHSDVVFLLSDDPKQAVKEFEPNPEVDSVWVGEEVIYHTRISDLRTKSRLSKIIGKSIYKQMTIRNWNTVMKLHTLLTEV